MAKGIGLIGNFRGKVGNMVGYNLKDSNNKQTQGVRVYQPVVKNPKTAGQAEQRAKLAPINATYRALKQIIDRGQEGKAYGNKSRLAWLSDAMKAFNGGWFEKGAAITAPALVPLTKGSLIDPAFDINLATSVKLVVDDMPDQSGATIGAISEAILAEYPALKDGDQITFVGFGQGSNGLAPAYESFEIDSQSTTVYAGNLVRDVEGISLTLTENKCYAGAIILSREGDNGQHLRTTTNIITGSEYPSDVQGAAAKAAAITSYMSQGANTDWAEESLQD